MLQRIAMQLNSEGSDVCPDEIFRKSMEYLFQEIHGTLIVDNPPG